MKTDIKNILIIKPSALGDIVQSLPVAGIIKKNWPGAKIIWLIKKQFADLLKDHPWIDGLILFDSKTAAKALRSFKAYKQVKPFFNQLKATDFDIALDLQGLFRSGFFAFKSSAKKRIGPSTAREFATVFYTDKIKPDPNNPSLLDYHIKMTEAAGCKKFNVGYGLKPNGNDIKRIQTLLKENNLKENNFAILACSSAQDYKCWPEEKFAVLADTISKKYNLKIAAVGTNADKDKIEKISKKAKTIIADLSGQTDIRQLMAVLYKSSIVISNDTGPGYIAYAMKKPVVFIYGPTNPGRVAQRGDNRTVAAIDAFSRGFVKESKNPNHRIEAVSVDMVLNKVCAWLNNLQPERRGQND